MITWRRLTEADFPLLISWLEQPHVARWWNHETSVAAVRRDFGPAVRGEEPSEDLLAHLDGAPMARPGLPGLPGLPGRVRRARRERRAGPGRCCVLRPVPGPSRSG
ncbi:GNAT family N-acetyltransferase [Streptomyces cyaneofuscatus]|uniref:GNAT family N-acetyltransferase n=1 Tax=Streptomyces cyaneofuscatus TaxID=66883 RepID=UPI0033AAA611